MLHIMYNIALKADLQQLHLVPCNLKGRTLAGGLCSCSLLLTLLY